MTALEQMISEMEKNLEEDVFDSILKKLIAIHIKLAKSMLAVENAQLEAEYQRGYQEGYHDAQNLH